MSNLAQQFNHAPKVPHSRSLFVHISPPFICFHVLIRCWMFPHFHFIFSPPLYWSIYLLSLDRCLFGYHLKHTQALNFAQRVDMLVLASALAALEHWKDPSRQRALYLGVPHGVEIHHNYILSKSSGDHPHFWLYRHFPFA